MNILCNCCLVQAGPEAKLSVCKSLMDIFCYWGSYWEITGQGPPRELDISNMGFVFHGGINQHKENSKRRVCGSFVV